MQSKGMTHVPAPSISIKLKEGTPVRRALTGKDGILTPLIKQLTEAALSAELDSHLASDVGSQS